MLSSAMRLHSSTLRHDLRLHTLDLGQAHKPASWAAHGDTAVHGLDSGCIMNLSSDCIKHPGAYLSKKV
jgi:hypothetical protein